MFNILNFKYNLTNKNKKPYYLMIKSKSLSL